MIMLLTKNELPERSDDRGAGGGMIGENATERQTIAPRARNTRNRMTMATGGDHQLSALEIVLGQCGVGLRADAAPATCDTTVGVSSWAAASNGSMLRSAWLMSPLMTTGMTAVRPSGAPDRAARGGKR